MAIVGVIPAAGYATRLQPLEGSKEVLHVGGKPVMDYLVERMRAGGCTLLRVVTRPEKEDLVVHAQSLGAEVVLGYPETVSASFALGLSDLAPDDVVLLGFPDSIWEPLDGFRPVVAAVEGGCDIAVGLFRIAPEDLTRSDVVVLGAGDSIAGIDVKPAEPRSGWVWGFAAGRAATWTGLERSEWPGGYIDDLCRKGARVCGVRFSGAWIDVGTRESLDRVDAGLRMGTLRESE